MLYVFFGGVIAVLPLHLGESQRNVCLMDSPEITIPPWGEASLCRSIVNPLPFLAIYPGSLYQEHSFDCNGCACAHFARRDIDIPSTTVLLENIADI